MSLTISAFALVAIAALGVAAFALALVVSVNLRLRELRTTVENSKPVKLSAEVAALDAALDAHRRVTRAEFGKVWQRFSGPPRRRGVVIEGEAVEVQDDDLETYTDPELAAMLALQRAPAAGPAKPNGR